MDADTLKLKRETKTGLGMCLDCSEPVTRNSVRCLKHLYRINTYDKYHRPQWSRDKHSRTVRELRERYRLEGKCRCGAPLVEGEGRRCENCLEKDRMRR